jgi:hypothetical protein
MSDTLVKWAKLTGKTKPQQKPQEKAQPQLGGEERKALAKLQDMARRAGATLPNGGKGGLPPSLVLGVMKRDHFTCKLCGQQENIGVHHKGGIEHPNSEWLAAQGHANTPENLVTICDACHDGVHNRDRASEDTGFEDDKPEENH